MKYANIRKREKTYNGKKTDYWICTYYPDPKGKGKEKWFPNKRHAEAFKAKKDRELHEGVTDTGEFKCGRVFDDWMERNERRGQAKEIWGNTLHAFRWSASYIKPEFEKKLMDEITSLEVEKFVNRLLQQPSKATGKPLARKSVHNIYCDLFEFFEWAVKHDKMRRNPLKAVPVEIKRTRKKALDIPSSDDIEKLIRFMSGSKPGPRTFLGWTNDKIAFALCAFAGLRPGEVSALHWDNIDLVNARLKIDDEKGSNSRIDGLKPPKSEAGVRTVPICQFLYERLFDHVYEERSALDAMGYKNIESRTGYVIKNAKHPDSKKPPEAGKITKSHRDLMLEAELVANGNIKFTTHKLRHWNISMYMQLGINVVNLAKRSGHSEPSITTDTYGHVLDGDEDGLPSDVPVIWKERFARAKPGLPRVIDGTIESSSLLELQATEVSSVTIPDNAMPWVAEAVQKLEGGWRISDVSRHFGHKARSTIFRGFAKAGLESPNFYVKQARERRYDQLFDKGCGDEEIGRLTNTSHVTVLNYRLARECGKPNTTKTLKERRKERSEEGVFRGKFIEKQPKLL